MIDACAAHRAGTRWRVRTLQAGDVRMLGMACVVYDPRSGDTHCLASEMGQILSCLIEAGPGGAERHTLRCPDALLDTLAALDLTVADIPAEPGA